MYDRCTIEMLELVGTFLTYSENWLAEGIIDRNTYLRITRNKEKFLRDIKESRSR